MGVESKGEWDNRSREVEESSCRGDVWKVVDGRGVADGRMGESSILMEAGRG